jgi:serine/threonine-protein kinase
MASSASSEPRPARRKKIGRYRIVDRIGKGAMGIVYSAVDDAMDRQVAVKVMMADVESDPDTRTRFYREARIAGQLMHRNIVTVFDLGEEDGRPYIVMELLRGFTLTDYLQRPEGVPLDTKLDLMIQVCEGLAVAHARDVFHRDVKPNNLFVLEDGSLKILDFGIARLASSTMTATGLVVGTPHYMSPEQARGEEIDARSDVFSTGAVFYFMLTGQKPFAARNSAGPDFVGVTRRVQFEDPSPVPEALAPPALVRIVLKALAKDRAKRHQTISDLARDLEAFRRVFDVETRRLAQSVIDRCRALDAVNAEIEAARIEVGIESPGTPRPMCSARERLAALVDDSGRALLVVPFKRDELAAMILSLEQEHEALLASRLAWRAAVHALRTGRDTLALAGPRLALPHFDAALRAAPESPAILAERDGCRAAAAERDAQDALVNGLLAQARKAAERQRWPDVITCCEAILEKDAGNAEALSRRARAREAMDREARGREQLVADGSRRLSAATSQRRFDDAAAVLHELRRSLPAGPEIERLEAELADARSRAAADAESVHLAAAAIEDARAAFGRGQRQDAIDGLSRFLSRGLHAPRVQAEIDRLTAEAARVTEAERRRAEAAALASHARSGLSDDPRAAAAAARSALQLNPDDTEARAVLTEAFISVCAALETAGRAEAVREALARGRELLSQSRLPDARVEVVCACALADDEAEPRALLGDVMRAEGEALVAHERNRLSRQRAGHVSALVTQAAAAIRRGEGELAARTLGRASALDPGNDALREMVADPVVLWGMAEAIARDSSGASETVPADTVDVGGFTARMQGWVASAGDPIAAVRARIADTLGRRGRGAGGDRKQA